MGKVGLNVPKNIPQRTQKKSTCCKVDITIIYSKLKEDTYYYQCTACKKHCDITDGKI